MKVLINKCYGGFGFSDEFLAHLKSIHPDMFTDYGLDYYYNDCRTDKRIIDEAIAFGYDPKDPDCLLASGLFARIVVEEVPDGCEYFIHEYDGSEHISHTCFNISENMLKRGLTDQEIETARKVTYLKVVSEADYWDGDASTHALAE